MKAKKTDNRAGPTPERTEAKSRRRRSLSSFFERALETQIAERAAWLEANKPPSYLGRKNSSYSSLERESLERQRFTVEYLKRQILWYPRPNTTWRDYAVEVASFRAREGLRHLQELAFAKDQQALSAIVSVGVSATRILTELSSRTPNRVAPIARRHFFWPFLKAQKERFGDDHKRLVKEIELGYDTPFSEAAASRCRADNTAVKRIMMLLSRIESFRHKENLIFRDPESEWREWEREATRLKRFSANTWPAWFETAWRALLADHEGHPERDPELRKIGLYRADHSTDKYSGTQTVASAKTRDANIRDGIREKLRKTVERLAVFPNCFSKK